MFAVKINGINIFGDEKYCLNFFFAVKNYAIKIICGKK
jgi:hypothetical protein